MKSFLQKTTNRIQSFWKNSPMWRKTLLNEEQKSFVAAIRKTDPLFRLFESFSNRFIVVFFASMLVILLYYTFAAWTSGMLHSKVFIFFDSTSEIMYMENAYHVVFPKDYSWWQRFLFMPINKQFVMYKIPVVGFFDNLGEFYAWLVSQPTTYASFIWLPIAMAGVVHHLKKNDVIVGLNDLGRFHYQKDLDFDSQVERLVKRLSMPWIPIVVMIFLVSVNVTYYFPLFSELSAFSRDKVVISNSDKEANAAGIPYPFESIGAKNWRQSMPPLQRPLELLAADFVYYAVITMGLRALFFTVWIIQIFRYNHVRIHPAHEDGVGGFGAIGSYLSRTGYIIGVYGGFILLTIMTKPQTWLEANPKMFVGLPTETGQSLYPAIIAYLLITPFVFFLPLWFGHQAMDRAKKQELRQISITYDEYYSNISGKIENMSLLNKNSPERDEEFLKAGVSSLNHIRQLSKEVQSYPSWPTKTNYQLRYAGSTILGPILITLFQEYVTRVILG